MILPDDRLGVRAVADAFRTSGNKDRTSFRNAIDLPLKDSKFRRVDEIVGEVDRQQRRLDLFEPWTGIVVPRCIDGVGGVVGIHSTKSPCGFALERLVGGFQRWSR